MKSSNVCYQLLEEKYPQGRTAYGIAVCDADDQGKILDQIKDITSDKSELSALIDRCNQLGLAYIHLADVIEDFLP